MTSPLLVDFDAGRLRSPADAIFLLPLPISMSMAVVGGDIVVVAVAECVIASSFSPPSSICFDIEAWTNCRRILITTCNRYFSSALAHHCHIHRRREARE